MPPSAKSSIAVRTMRVGELVNSGLTHPSATADSQNARNASMDMVPSKAFSCRARKGLGGVGFAADCASFAAVMSAFMMIGPRRPGRRAGTHTPQPNERARPMGPCFRRDDNRETLAQQPHAKPQ